MLDKTQKKLQSYFDNEPQICADGQRREMDGVTKIKLGQCESLAALHKKVKPDLSVETGLAYGFSTLPILDAMEEHDYGRHIAIDPGQMSYWHGVALASIDQLGFSSRFTWIEARSDRALLDLIDQQKRAQFVFFDGLHSFDGIMTDFFLADQILDIDGLLVFNYMWMPVGRTIASFISSNLPHYKSAPTDNEIMFAFRKVGKDTRQWDHFAPFDGSGGEKKKGFLQNILRG